MQNSIGLDVGHSAVKIASADSRISVVSAATKAISLSTPTAQDAAKADTVTVDGSDWLVGDSALVHTLGRVTDGLRDDWIETPEYAALLKAGYDRGIHASGAVPDMVVVGLPSRLYAAQRAHLAKIAADVTETDKAHVRVLPQPLAAFFVHALADGASRGAAEGGAATDGAMDESWVVVDVGYYTTDFGLVSKGIWAETSAQSAPGVASAADVVRRGLTDALGIDADMRKSNDVLRTKSVRYDGKVHDFTNQVDAAAEQFATVVMERAERALGSHLHDADGVLVVGGGASLVFRQLHKRWPHAIVPENPRFAVAEGMLKAGELV